MKKQRPIKSIGRKRRVAGWTLLLLGLLVAAVWVASGWWEMGASVPPSEVAVRNGIVWVFDDDARSRRPLRSAGRSAWFVRLPGNEFGWHSNCNVFDWPESNALGSDGWIYRRYGRAELDGLVWDKVVVLLWPIPLFLWSPAALLLRSGILARRRAVTGSCAKCGYSLAGLAPDAPCPECGKGGEAKKG